MSAVEQRRVVGLVEAFLDGRLSMDHLQDVLFTITWDNPDAPPIAHRVEHLIAEVRSDDDLRRALAEAVSACYARA